MGQGKSIVIVIPAELPPAETFTVSICKDNIRFRAGRDEIADIPYKNREVYDRLSFAHEVGLVEFPKDQPFPDCITNVAYIEVRKTLQ